jgi:quercetin dioxygenase-like cupin family protein
MALTAEQMHNKVYLLGENRPVKLGGGVTRRLLAAIGNLTLHVCDALPSMTFDMAASQDEVVLFFLDGCAQFDGRRIVRGDEAIIQCPGNPLHGQMMGVEGIRFLEIRARSFPGANPLDPALMKQVMRLDEIKPVRRAGSGSYARLIHGSESCAVEVAENRPVVELPDPGHPENEIVYVLRGKIEYLNGPGRVVRPGECVTNVPNVPHPLRYAGTEPVRIMEILSPPYGKPVPGGAAPGKRGIKSGK